MNDTLVNIAVLVGWAVFWFYQGWKLNDHKWKDFKILHEKKIQKALHEADKMVERFEKLDIPKKWEKYQ